MASLIYIEETRDAAKRALGRARDDIFMARSSLSATERAGWLEWFKIDHATARVHLRMLRKAIAHEAALTEAMARDKAAGLI